MRTFCWTEMACATDDKELCALFNLVELIHPKIVEGQWTRWTDETRVDEALTG